MDPEALMETSFNHFSILLITQLTEKRKIFPSLSFVSFSSTISNFLIRFPLSKIFHGDVSISMVNQGSPVKRGD